MTTTGSLFVCATPIGNLSDTSQRLLDTLQQVDLIAAEDTRVTQKLCQRFNITTPLLSLDQHQEKKRTSQLINKLQSGKNIALVSDAGTPNIADPGAYLIQELHNHHIPIIPIPGPSSITTFLSVAGLLANQFHFLGFLPKKESELATTLAPITQLECPIIAFETAKRLKKTCDYLINHYPITTIALGKELTKAHETIIIATATTLEEKLTTIPLKGEWILAFTLDTKHNQDTHITNTINCFKDQNLTRTQAIAIGKHLGVPKNTIYNAYINP